MFINNFNNITALLTRMLWAIFELYKVGFQAIKVDDREEISSVSTANRKGSVSNRNENLSKVRTLKYLTIQKVRFD